MRTYLDVHVDKLENRVLPLSRIFVTIINPRTNLIYVHQRRAALTDERISTKAPSLAFDVQKMTMNN